MNAYTSSSSSRAMSVARVAVGSSTTSAACSDRAAGSSGRRGPRLTVRLHEQVSAEQVGGARTLHVRSRVHHDVPGAGGRRIGGGDVRFDVGVALTVGDD